MTVCSFDVNRLLIENWQDCKKKKHVLNKRFIIRRKSNYRVAYSTCPLGLALIGFQSGVLACYDISQLQLSNGHPHTGIRFSLRIHSRDRDR